MRYAAGLMMVLVSLAALAAPAAGGVPPPPDEAAIARGLEAAARGDYSAALGVFNRIAARSPERPEGYFFRAAVFQLMKGHFDRRAFREGLEKNAARALETAEGLLRSRPGDARLLLIAGLANGMLAVDAIHRRRYISGLWRGRKMTVLLERAVRADPALDDAYYGLGVYHIIRSRPPWGRLVSYFTRGDAGRGRAYLARAAGGKGWLRVLARVDLVWALYREKRFREAREALAPLRARYPENPLYGVAFAEGYFLAKDYPRARAEYLALQRRLQRRGDEFSRLYARFAEWRVVRSDFEMGRYARAGAGARAVLKKPGMDSTLLRQIRAGAASMLESLGRTGLPRGGAALP